MQTKKCTKCGEVKGFNEFSKNKRTRNGFDFQCKKCKSIYKKIHYHTKEGLATQIYVHQRGRSKRRNHPPPAYSKKELKEWLFSRENFPALFDQWERSGFNKNLSPSIDRKDDYVPYTLNNIQLMTWEENNRKGRMDILGGVNKKTLVPVIGVCKKTGKVIEFYSIAEAKRKTNASACGIVNICKNKKGHVSSGGYLWHYKSNYYEQTNID